MKTDGDAVVVHGLRGRSSNRRIDEQTLARVVELLKQSEWHDFGPTFASQQLAKRHGIEVSKETVRGWMVAAELWKARPRKLGEKHFWRPRRSGYGELVQWDTSTHDWLEGRPGGDLHGGAAGQGKRPAAPGSGSLNAVRPRPARGGNRLDPGILAAGQGLRFILHLLRTADDILWKAPPFGEPDALCFARRIGSGILIQPVVSIVHRIAVEQAVVPPSDHTLGTDVQSRRHFFECQQALLA